MIHYAWLIVASIPTWIVVFFWAKSKRDRRRMQEQLLPLLQVPKGEYVLVYWNQYNGSTSQTILASTIEHPQRKFYRCDRFWGIEHGWGLFKNVDTLEDPYFEYQDQPPVIKLPVSEQMITMRILEGYSYFTELFAAPEIMVLVENVPGGLREFGKIFQEESPELPPFPAAGFPIVLHRSMLARSGESPLQWVRVSSSSKEDVGLAAS